MRGVFPADEGLDNETRINDKAVKYSRLPRFEKIVRGLEHDPAEGGAREVRAKAGHDLGFRPLGIHQENVGRRGHPGITDGFRGRNTDMETMLVGGTFHRMERGASRIARIVGVEREHALVAGQGSWENPGARSSPKQPASTRR